MRVYVDTSVFGGVYDKEFGFFSDLFFKMMAESQSIILTSDVVYSELEGSPQKVQQVLDDIPNDRKVHLSMDARAILLARKYIEEGVVGQTSEADCTHIAIATIHNADILVSWNFKHIVNVHKINGYNSVNLAEGYNHLEIRNPREALNYE